jgi:hypothetical protein
VVGINIWKAKLKKSVYKAIEEKISPIDWEEFMQKQN